MKSTQFTFRTIFLLFLENMRNYEFETEWKGRTRGCHHRAARPDLGPRRPMVWPPRRPFPTLVRSGAFLLSRIFLLYNPPDPWRSVYRFLDVFCFELFLPGFVSDPEPSCLRRELRRTAPARMLATCTWRS